MVKKITITLTRSHIGRPKKHKDVLLGMGLTKLNKSVQLLDTKETRGMIKKVEHLVKVSD